MIGNRDEMKRGVVLAADTSHVLYNTQVNQRQRMVILYSRNYGS